MKRDFKTGLILLTVMSVISVSAAGVFIVLQQEERNKRILAERELDMTTRMKTAIERQLASVKSEKRAIELELGDLRMQVSSMRNNLKSSIELSERLRTQLNEKSKELEDLKIKLSKKEDVRLKLAADLAEMEKTYKNLKQELADLQLAKATISGTLPSPVSEVRTDSPVSPVDLDKIVVTEQEKPILSGQVLVVNKEFNFVVVDWGKRDGVFQGDVLQLCRNDSVVGEARVEKVYEYMSAATILNENMGSGIREGDEVRRK